MNNPINLDAFRQDAAKLKALEAAVRLSGGGGDGGNLEERINRLEEHVGNIRVDVAEIKAVLPTLSTKSDLSDAKFGVVVWLVSTALAAIALLLAGLKMILP